MNRKTKTLFGLDKTANYDGKEDTEMKNKEPYLVFQTEEEFVAAVDEELAKRNQAEPKKPDASAEGDDERRKKLIAEWQRDASELKELVPEFDFASALRNEVFRKALTSGKSVFAAYSEMTRVPKQPERDELHQNARSPRRGTGEAAINPAKLSSEDFKKYINNIKNQ